MVNNNVKYLVLIFLSILIQEVCSGQVKSRTEKQFSKAKQFYFAENYLQALHEVQDVMKKQPEYLDAILLQAEIYNKLDSTIAEFYTLKKALEISDKPLIIYRTANAAYSVGWYKEGLTYFEKFMDNESISAKRKNEVKHKIENCRFAIQAMNNPVEFEPKKLSEKINSKFDEYWPSLSVDQQKLVFTRLVNSYGEYLQEDFFESDLKSGEWSQAVPITEINSNQNEGAQSLSADGKILFFTACNRPGGEGSCDIYFSRKIHNKWTNPRNAGTPVNTVYWESQPSFSSDSRCLYFSSNRPGGKGEKDIWRVQLNGYHENGDFKWGEPENLGDQINTEGNEISPFIHPNNKNFYFASNQHIGMGGLDLFQSELDKNNHFSEVKNLGFPINTYKDEQGLTISADGLMSYFSSARDPETGLDIYGFKTVESIRPLPVTYVKAVIIDSSTKRPIQARIELKDLTKKEKSTRLEVADKEGEVFLCLPIGANYAFNVSAEGYLFYSNSFPLLDTKTIYEPYKILIELQSIEIGAEMNLNNIYFSINSYNLLPESETELNKLYEFLNSNPGLSIEIQGHTDNTGSELNNDKLSELRAKSVVDFLLSKGINTARLQYKGFGQHKPVASNNTEEGRRLNRRTTIKINGK